MNNMAIGEHLEFYAEHNPPFRRAAARQYVYDIGSYHYNWHPQVEILVIIGGKVEVCTADGISVLSRGDVAVLNSNEGHATMSLEPNDGALSAQVLLLHLDPGYVASFNDGIIPSFQCRSTSRTRNHEGFAALRELSARMMLVGLQSGPAAIAQYEALLAEVCAVLFRHFHVASEFVAKTADEDDYVDVLRRVTEYINSHYSEKLTLKSVARRAGYSPTYFSELFSSHMGIPLTEHITRVRLAQAVRLLGESKDTIADIARATGFPDIKAFGVAFKRAFNKTASQYRQQLRDIASQGLALDQVDRSFHKRFARREDYTVLSALREFAQPRTPVEGICRSEHERVLAELRELSGLARQLGVRLEQLSDG